MIANFLERGFEDFGAILQTGLLFVREFRLQNIDDAAAAHNARQGQRHTPTKNGLPDQRPNRLNLDTGAVYGRALTSAVFIDETIFRRVGYNGIRR
jgi:hypothetical protein